MDDDVLFEVSSESPRDAEQKRNAFYPYVVEERWMPDCEWEAAEYFYFRWRAKRYAREWASYGYFDCRVRVNPLYTARLAHRAAERALRAQGKS